MVCISQRKSLGERSSPPGTGRAIQISFCVSVETNDGSEFPFANQLVGVVSQMAPPGIGGAGEPRNEASGVVPRNASAARLLKVARSASLAVNKERCAKT